MRTFGPILRSAVDLLFPQHCKVCRQPVDDGVTTLCLACGRAVERLRRQESCPTCAATVAKYEVSQSRCGKCRRRRWPITGMVRVGPYRTEQDDEALGVLLRLYKYHGRTELEPLLGGWLTEVVARAAWQSRIEAIVSVPTHWKHRLSRPLYAADALASVVAQKTGLPHLPILRRVRGGPHQIGLSYTARIENVRGAFALRRGATLQEARLLLIDDVKTTGATVSECAKVLRRGGAAEVYGAVVVTAGWARPTGQALSSI